MTSSFALRLSARAAAFAAGAASVLLGWDAARPGTSTGAFLRRLGRRLGEAFLLGFALSSIVRLLNLYGYLLERPSAAGAAFAVCFLMSLAAFLKVFFPRTWAWAMPGRRPMLCPQCFRRRVFRFTPLHPGLALFASWSCPECSCLADREGNRLFYPARVDAGALAGPLAAATFASLAVYGLSGWAAMRFWRAVGLWWFL